ncbi:gustatory and odorant receptor 63a-like [Musca domestica]|uniref:Gustatory receptor n=1 Tax=Musca domestica TaxID=7370 RepID=I0E1X8_MUSDO|nr:gustatory and odorant receptor 63a-like [Musca domestica]AFH96946.1 gustatory receptor 2 [Musca domestica]
MASNYTRKKKKDAVFLNVKPIMNGDISVRKYSNGIMDQMHNGFRKQVYERANIRPSLATISSTNQQFIPNVFYQNVAPIKWFLSVLGVLPIIRSGPGTTRFVARSLPFVYCVVIFICLSAYVAYVTNQRIMIVTSLSGPFEEAVIAYLFLVNILPIFTVPIMWWETRKVCTLFNDWDDFEILYYQISGHSVPLNLRRRAQNIVLVLPILSILSVIVTHITMADFSFIQVIPYCILDNLTAMLGAWWYLICEALSRTAYILAERFQKALRHIGPAAMVADHRALWLRLSKLTRDTGTATCYTFTFLNLYLFFIITLSIYGLMSQLSEGFGIKDIGLAITALWNICLLFFICDQAHNASLYVRTNFQKKLLMVELNWMNSDAQTEINMFLRATEMNPSNINCGGFFDVNRNLFKGLLTTMVTYLVVLLQFQISIPNVIQGINSNMTLIEAITMMITDSDYSGESEEATTTTTTALPKTTKIISTGTRGRKG